MRPTGDSLSLRASLYFAGQTLIEFQARQAARAGATHILILVNVITPALSQAVDRLSADGIAVALVRDMVTIVRTAPRDGDALLIADGAILSQSSLEAVVGADGDALLVTDDSRASAAFERIDAGQRWGGAVRVSPALLFGTLDMIGDWDLALTLVRSAVQQGARRITIAQDDLLEGRVAMVESQPQADLAAQAAMAVAPRAAARSGGVERYLLAPIARRIAPALVRTQVSASHMRTGAIVLAAVALVPIELTWPGTGFLLLLASLLFSEVADRVDEIALRPVPLGWTAFVTPAIALTGIALAGRTAVTVYLALLLAILCVAIRRERTRATAGWQLMTPGTALLILFVTNLLDAFSLGIDSAMLATLASLAVILLRPVAPEG